MNTRMICLLVLLLSGCSQDLEASSYFPKSHDVAGVLIRNMSGQTTLQTRDRVAIDAILSALAPADGRAHRWAKSETGMAPECYIAIELSDGSTIDYCIYNTLIVVNLDRKIKWYSKNTDSIIKKYNK